MKQLNILATSLALLIIASRAQAQPYIDLFQGFYQVAPSTERVKTFTHYRMQANIPVVFKKSGDIFLVNPIWEGRRIVYNGFTPIPYDLTGFITWFTYTRQLGKGRSLTLAAIPRWNGDPDVQWSKGFQMGGAALYSWKQKENLELKLGLYYNREFFGNFFIPLVGLDWTINKKDRLFGTLPGYLTYEHRITDRISWGAAFRTFTNSYRLRTYPYPEPAPSPDYMRVDDNQLGVYADLYAAPKWVFTFEAGASILRKLRTGFLYQPANVKLENTTEPYFRLAFQYRLRLDKPKR